MTEDEVIEELQQQMLQAQARLTEYIFRLCPKHDPIQHRDHQPSWCNHCGRTAHGTLIRKR